MYVLTYCRMFVCACHWSTCVNCGCTCVCSYVWSNVRMFILAYKFAVQTNQGYIKFIDSLMAFIMNWYKWLQAIQNLHLIVLQFAFTI